MLSRLWMFRSVPLDCNNMVLLVDTWGSVECGACNFRDHSCFHKLHYIEGIYYNNPTRCSRAQSISFHCSVTLHVSGAFHTHHQEYINCIYSLRYRSYIGAATFLLRGRVWTSLNSATLEECSCTDVWPVPEAVDAVDVLLMMGVESTRNM